MAARKRVTIEQWITEAFSDKDKPNELTVLSLMYIKPNGAQEEVHSKSLAGATHNPKTLAEFFLNKATGYCQDLPGISTFKLLAFYGMDQPQATFPFTIAEGDLTASGDLAFSRHEPSEKGLLAQLMKHNENLMSMITTVTQTFLVQGTLRENKLREEVTEAQSIVRDVIFNMKKEDHEHKMAQLKFQRESEERAMMAKALPALLNQVTGRDVIPQATVDSQILDLLAHKVKPEHMQLLVQLGLLNEQQAAMLAARFTKTLEREEAERAALRAAPSEELKPTNQAIQAEVLP